MSTRSRRGPPDSSVRCAQPALHEPPLTQSAAFARLDSRPQLAQLVTALVLPTVAERRMDRRPVVLAAGACSITGAVLLLVAPGTTAWLATVILGLGLGGGFTLGLVLIADLAGSPAAATGIAAMTFLVCYLTASTAPIAVGALHDLSGGFTAPFGALALVAAMQFVIAARLRPHLRGSVS